MHKPRNYELAIIEALMQPAPHFWFLLNPKLEIIAISNSYEKVTKIECCSMIGRHIFEIFSDNLHPDVDDMKNSLKTYSAQLR